MKKILLLILAVFAVIPAWSVTEKEMDQARAIAAKYYLRWANNGSGYLDEISPKSMADLNSRLKAKEKENIKAFNAVKVPSAAEYAKWDKEKLAEFWSVTAFQTPGLSAEGRGGRSKARKVIMEMSVSAPSKAAAETKPEEPAKEAAKSAEGAEEAAMADTIIGALTDLPEKPASDDEILNDQKQIEKDAREASLTEPEQSHTWVYILVLAILVGVVIWLVVYAANLMKRQPGAIGGDDDNNAELRAQAKKAIAKKNEEIEELHRRLQAEENRSADLGAELEKLKLECKRKDDKIDMLREENVMLRSNSTAAARVEQPRPQPQSQPRPVPAAHTEPASRADRKEEEAAVAAPILKVIYLGRANARGIFVRADRKINAGNTIYRLDTNDGLVGTFHVVDEPEVVEVAVSNPSEYLGNGCVCEDLDDTLGVTRIITESAGTAIFENGYWKVLRKTKVRYE